MANETTTAKVTISQNYDKVIAFLTEKGADQEMIDFLNDRKAKSHKTHVSKANPQRDLYASLIKEVVESNKESMTITEIMNLNDTLRPLSNQMVASVAKSLVESNVLKKETVKGKARYSLA